MATCSSILTWKISWTKELRRLQLMGLQSVDMIEHVCTKLVTCNNESYKVSHSVVSNSLRPHGP